MSIGNRPNYSRGRLPGYNLNQAQNFFTGLSPASEGYYEQNQQEALGNYVDQLRASPNISDYLKSLYSLLNSQWLGQVEQRAQQGTNYRWTDFLRDWDPGKQLGRVDSRTKGMVPQQFTGRARTVQF